MLSMFLWFLFIHSLGNLDQLHKDSHIRSLIDIFLAQTQQCIEDLSYRANLEMALSILSEFNNLWDVLCIVTWLQSQHDGVTMALHYFSWKFCYFNEGSMFFGLLHYPSTLPFLLCSLLPWSSQHLFSLEFCLASRYTQIVNDLSQQLLHCLKRLTQCYWLFVD